MQGVTPMPTQVLKYLSVVFENSLVQKIIALYFTFLLVLEVVKLSTEPDRHCRMHSTE